MFYLFFLYQGRFNFATRKKQGKNANRFLFASRVVEIFITI